MPEEVSVKVHYEFDEAGICITFQYVLEKEMKTLKLECKQRGIRKECRIFSP